MKVPSERRALQDVGRRLGELLQVESPAETAYAQQSLGVDAALDLADFTFLIEWKGSGAAAPVAMAVEQVLRAANAIRGRVIPLVAVPFMGEVGRQRCREADVAWIDLSGNASISAPGIRVLVEGKPNLFKRRGRPSSAFAPKSARIARWLLMHPSRAATQREIAKATDMDEGFTSRIVGRLEEDGLVLRDPSGAIRAADPNLLLEAWTEDYDFSSHWILRGHRPARSGQQLLTMMAADLHDEEVRYAATGLAAAWLLTRFAGFRTVALYVSSRPDSGLLDRLEIRQESRGANVWLLVPSDEGVFHGASEIEGVQCVHPIQAYLDLAGQPERADEAAANLRRDLLSMSPHV